MRRRPRPLRLCLGFAEVAGFYRNLEAGFAELGIEAKHLPFESHRFAYGSSSEPALVGTLRRARERRERAADGSSARRQWEALRERALRVIFLAWILARFDAFIFGFANTLLETRDLPLFRLLHKRCVVVFHGSDERPPYINGAITARLHPDGKASSDLAREIKRRVVRIDKYADVVVGHVLSAHFHNRPIVPLLWLGLPQEPVVRDHPPGQPGGPTRILHAPSGPYKGTELVRLAIRRLEAKGHAIEYVELTDRPNAEVLAELRQADLVVDEVWSDSPMAGLAAEAAAAGTPVVVGGYGWDRIEATTPPEDLPPTVRCLPEDIESTIEKLLANRDLIMDLGLQAQRFIAERWTPRDVAARYLRLVREGPPASWLIDAAEFEYVEGTGMPRSQVRASVAAVLGAGGPAALCLDSRPPVRDAFIRFAADPA